MGTSAKSQNGTKDYYGHVAGSVCQGQLDFIWGVLMNNELVWPQAKEWDSKVYANGRQVIWSDLNTYRASAKTSVDPNGFPWVLYATPWTAGTYVVGTRKEYLGNVWIVVGSSATVAPPATAPAGNRTLDLQTASSTNHWQYVSTPDTWSSATRFWAINSVVAWRGMLWTNSAATNAEPPTAPWTRWKIDRGSSANPLKFTVPDGGDVFLYWGTANQQLDTVDEQILFALGHPPYRNKAIIFLKDFFFGTMQQSPPDIQVMGGRNPVQTLITGGAADLDDDWQANPWCVLAEFLTHPVIGLGLPDSMFDATSWQAEADRCAVNPEFYYISPIYTSTGKVRELVAELMGYPDAFVFWTALGTIAAGHWPHGEAAPTFDATNTVDRDCWAEEPKGETDSWGGTANSVQLSFQDFQAAFQDRPIVAPNLFNQRVVKRMTSMQVSRPFITRYAQAVQWATESAKILGDQVFKGTVKIKAEKATGVQAGSPFLLTDDVLGVSQAHRCTRKVLSAPPDGTVTLTHETERGLAPQPYAPTPENPLPDAGPAPAKVGNFGVFQLPSALGDPSSIAVISGRKDAITTALDIYFRQADGASFQLLGTNSFFAVPAKFFIKTNDEAVMPNGDSATIDLLGAITNGNTYTLSTKGWWQIQVHYFTASNYLTGHVVGVEDIDYTADRDAGTVTILPTGSIVTGRYVEVKMFDKLVVSYDTNTPQSDIDLVTSSLTEDEIANGEVLLFAFRADNPALCEIMTVREITAAGTAGGIAYWFVRVFRQFFSTQPGGDNTGYEWNTNSNDMVFIIRKSALNPLFHVSFPGLQAGSSPMSLRLAPESAWVAADPEDVYDPATNPAGLVEAFDFTWAPVFPPTVTFVDIQDNGTSITDFTTVKNATHTYTVEFQMDDANGDLVSASLVAMNGQKEVVLWSSHFDKTDSRNQSVDFTLPIGNWAIEVRMIDAAFNHKNVRMNYAGVDVSLWLGTAVAPTPILYVPSVHRTFGRMVFLQFGLLPSTCGVNYQITSRNATAPTIGGGGWTACATHGVAIGGLYRFGDPAMLTGTLPPIKFGDNGQTLWAYCTKSGLTHSDIVKWNFSGRGPVIASGSIV